MEVPQVVEKPVVPPSPVVFWDYEIGRFREGSGGTYGRLVDTKGNFICYTLELPWVDVDKNGIRDRNVSRFKPGLYRCHRAIHHPESTHPYEVWELEDVENGDKIHIHVANLIAELKGCVALGEAFGQVQRPGDRVPLPGIIGSQTAFDRFMKMTADKDFIYLKVSDQFQAAA